MSASYKPEGYTRVAPRSRKKDDPDKRGGVKDAGGTTCWIGTQVG